MIAKRLISVLLFFAMASFRLQAQDPQDTALAAAGLFSLVGFGNQIATRSKLSVKVEMYQKPFNLGHPLPRTHGMLVPNVDEIQEFINLLGPTVEGLHEDLSTAEQAVSAIDASLIQTSDVVRVIYEGFRTKQAAITAAIAAIERLQSSASSLNLSSDVNLVALQSQRQEAITRLEQAQQTSISEALLSSLASNVDLELGGSAVSDVELAQSDEMPPIDRLAQILNELRKVMPTAKSEAIDGVLASHHVGISALELQGSKSESEIKAMLTRSNHAMGILTTESQVNARLHVAENIVRQSNLLTSFNQGPVVNEAMQAVLTLPGLDEITSEANKQKWVEYNTASSIGRTGDHAAVIYLENHATPVLKSARFNPDAFIQANGKLYRTAFETTSQMFGLPSGSVDQPAAGLPSLNHFVIENKLAKVKAAKRQRNQLLLKTVANILAIDSGGGTSTEKSDKAAAELSSAATSLPKP